MLLTIITALLLLTYLTSFALPLSDVKRCIVDYGMLVYMGWIMWKLIVMEEDK